MDRQNQIELYVKINLSIIEKLMSCILKLLENLVIHLYTYIF